MAEFDELNCIASDDEFADYIEPDDVQGDDEGDEEDIDWDAAFSDQDESNQKIAEDAEAERVKEREDKMAAINARKEARKAAQESAQEGQTPAGDLDEMEDYDPLKDVPEEYYTTRKGRNARIIPYDFRRPIQLSKGFFRNLNIVGETYAKLLTLTLSNYLRVPATVTSNGVRQVLFEEYTSTIANPSCINILDMMPIKIPGMLDVDLALVFSMIEKLLGSHTVENTVRREFTTIETRITRKIINRMLSDLRESMLRLLEVNVSLTSIEHNPDFTYIMNANDPCIIMSFEIELNDFKGQMSVCISLAALDAEIGNEGISGYRDVRSDLDRERDGQNVGTVLDSTKVDLVAEIAKVEMAYSDLLDLSVGSIINLRKQMHEPLTIRMEDCAVFEGKMGRSNRKTAFKVSKILWPNQEPLAGILENYTSEGA
ncbi:MAG: hypothetical protein GY835_20055 [bacterium]|nr:hypothetical protein [bacterium]